MNDILDKYSNSILKNLDRENINKIIEFLKKEKCDYIEDLLEDYLDIFTIDYDIFVKKYNMLNKKYNGNYLVLASSNMNLLEELFYD